MGQQCIAARRGQHTGGASWAAGLGNRCRTDRAPTSPPARPGAPAQEAASLRRSRGASQPVGSVPSHPRPHGTGLTRVTSRISWECLPRPDRERRSHKRPLPCSLSLGEASHHTAKTPGQPVKGPMKRGPRPPTQTSTDLPGEHEPPWKWISCLHQALS